MEQLIYCILKPTTPFKFLTLWLLLENAALFLGKNMVVLRRHYAPDTTCPPIKIRSSSHRSTRPYRNTITQRGPLHRTHSALDNPDNSDTATTWCPGETPYQGANIQIQALPAQTWNFYGTFPEG